jgi:ADP-dependent NAD(P)H-hydrate dehydratase / NAD(P)H-hydrate epimerase
VHYHEAMKILTAAEMQACDRATTERFGIAPGTLMRNAARAVADFARMEFPGARRITVLCGRGYNGGDGLHAARMLAEAGCEVTVLLLGDPTGLKGDPAEAWALLKAVASSGQHVILTTDDLSQQSQALNADLILDAVVGTGFRPPLRDLPLAALEWLKQSKAPILSVDLPSGWDSDSTEGSAEGAYPADAVVTFTAPKPAHVFGQLTRQWNQPVVVAPIGSPEEAIESTHRLHWSGASKAITDPARPVESNKGMYGHVLVIGGSPGKSGAPGMASLSAMRIGAGLVTAAVTPSVLPLVAALAPELMTQALAVDPAGQIAAGNLDPKLLEKLLKGITVLAIGPGLGTEPAAEEFVFGLLTASRLPAVADADALNAIARHPERLPELAKGRTLVLTPHPGEMGRLAGVSVKEIQKDRIGIARQFAQKNGVILVLKGSRTLIAHPDGNIAVNTTGNPAMAKGGSGDLLTGMVAGLLAQYPKDAARAVEAAVYLHGLAANFAMGHHDQHTLLATDSLAYLPQAFRFRPEMSDSSRGHSGYGWLQGLPRRSAAI